MRAEDYNPIRNRTIDVGQLRATAAAIADERQTIPSGAFVHSSAGLVQLPNANTTPTDGQFTVTNLTVTGTEEYTATSITTHDSGSTDTYAAGSVLNYAGPTINVTANTTATISTGKTLSFVGGTVDFTGTTVTGVSGGGGGSGGATVAVVAGDVSTAAAMANVTGLSFPVAANETWVAEFFLFVVGTAAGLNLQVTGPAAPALVRFEAFGTDNNTRAFVSDADGINAFSTPTTVGFVDNSAGFVGLVRCQLSVVNGANAGTVQLQAASVTAGQANVIKAGSYLVANNKAAGLAVAVNDANNIVANEVFGG